MSHNAYLNEKERIKMSQNSESDEQSLSEIEEENEQLGQEILQDVKANPEIEYTWITSLIGADGTLAQFLEYCGIRDPKNVPEWMHVYFANRERLRKEAKIE